jgi:hypothetical protein
MSTVDSFRKVKRSKREADHSPPTGARDNFTFYYERCYDRKRSQNLISARESHKRNIIGFLMEMFKFVYQYIIETKCENHKNDRMFFQRTGHSDIQAYAAAATAT